MGSLFPLPVFLSYDYAEQDAYFPQNQQLDFLLILYTVYHNLQVVFYKIHIYSLFYMYITFYKKNQSYLTEYLLIEYLSYTFVLPFCISYAKLGI